MNFQKRLQKLHEKNMDSIYAIVPTDVSNKWKYLKEKFIMSRKAFCNLPASGSSASEIALLKLNLYKHMTF